VGHALHPAPVKAGAAHGGGGGGAKSLGWATGVSAADPAGSGMAAPVPGPVGPIFLGQPQGRWSVHRQPQERGRLDPKPPVNRKFENLPVFRSVQSGLKELRPNNGGLTANRP
jgi:hypothetical protein